MVACNMVCDGSLQGISLILVRQEVLLAGLSTKPVVDVDLLAPTQYQLITKCNYYVTTPIMTMVCDYDQ